MRCECCGWICRCRRSSKLNRLRAPSAKNNQAMAKSKSATAAPSPASAGRADPQLIEDLVAANRILAHQGVLDGWGHVSARRNRDPNRYLLACSRAPELVTAQDLIEFDLDSNPINARGRNLY